jgi:hypothetical protein
LAAALRAGPNAAISFYEWSSDALISQPSL